MLVRRDDAFEPIAERISFADWVRDGHALGRATADDLDYHLTTLFPPVRPRRWMEIRYLDALPDPWWRVAAAVVTTVPRRRRRRCRRRGRLRPWPARWYTSARCGLTDPAFRRAALATVLAGAARLRPRRRERLDRPVVRRLRCPLPRARPLAGRRRARRVAAGRPLVRPRPGANATPRAEGAERTVVSRQPGRSPDQPSRRSTPAGGRSTCSNRSTTTTCPPALAAHVAAGVGPGAHRQLRGAVAGAGRSVAEPASARSSTTLYDAFRHPRPDRPALPLLGAGRGPRLRRRGAGPGPRRRSTALTVRPARCRCSRRLRVRHGRAARAPARRDDAGHAPADGGDGLPARRPAARPPPPTVGRRGRGARSRRPVRDGNRRRAVGVRQRAARPRGRRAAVLDRPARSPTASTSSSSTTAATTSRRWWTPAGWAWRQRGRPRAPRSSGGATAAGLGRGVASAGSSRCRPTSPCSTSAGTRPTPTPAGPGKRLPTEAEWEKAAAGTRHGRSRRFPWGDEPPAPDRANLGQRHFGPAPVGAYPAGASAYGVRADGRRRVGVDGVRLHGLSRASWRSRTASTRRSSSAPTTRCCAAARGPPTRRAVRTTFRNWDYPIRRQIFAGFRCARDA